MPPLDTRTLTSLVAEQIADTPERIAVVDGERRISYEELDVRCGQIASGLQGAGVGRADLVAVLLPRSADIVAALLAVHRIGAAYVPLDPAYPADRLDFMIQDCHPRAVLCAPETLGLATDLAENTDTALIDLGGLDLAPDLGDGTPAQAPNAVPNDVPVEPGDLAYVIYTSGSTGRPKGAMLEHRNTVAMLDWVHAEFTAADLDGVLFGTSICFDLSIFEIFAPLTMGGTLVVAQNALELPELPARDRVTLLNTVPAVTAALLASGDLPASVRTVIHSGDTTTRALVDAIYAVPTVQRFYNLYGPTEVVTWQTGLLVDRDDTAEPPIGRPFPRVGIHLLDADGREVGPGEVGELHLSGDQVCRGYLGRPELTAEKFVSRPDLADGPVYRTGDLVRRDESGMLHFHGRTDFQIKIRGFRVELGEIEAVLERHPAVQDSVVVADGSGAGDRRIVAFAQVDAGVAAAAGVTSEAGGVLRGQPIDGLVAELRAGLAASLPAYMMPSTFGLLATLPLTANGKPDRQRLPDLSTGVAEVSAGLPPAGPVEQSIADIWAEVLGHSDIPADAGFAELGGDSLLAAGVVSRIRNRMGVRLTLPQFGAGQTVAGLAALLRGQDRDETPATLEHHDEVAPPTPAIVDFWLGDIVAEGRATWTVPLVVQVTGPLRETVLQWALDELVRRHVALRTAVTDEHTRTAIPAYPVPLEVLDLGTEPIADRARTLRAAQHAEATRYIDPSTGQLLRAQLVRTDRDRAELLLHAHHLAVDGLSSRPLLADLAELYAAFAEGTPPAGAGVPDYDDALRWVAADDRTAADRRAAHWAERLAGVPSEQGAPGGRVLSADPGDGGRVECPLDPALAGRLRDYGRRAGTSAFAMVLAAAAIRVHRETGRTDILLTAPVSRRGHPDIERVVGMLIDTALVRCDLTGNPTFGQLVDRIGAGVAADLEVGVPSSAVQHAATGNGRPRTVRPEHLMIAMQRGEPTVSRGGLSWTIRRELDNGGAKTDFTVFWEADMPHPQVSGEFARDRYTEADARQLLEQIVTLADAGTAAPDTPIGDLDWLDRTDLPHLTAWSGVERARGTTGSTVQAVLDAATHRPDAVAIDCPYAGPVTYRMLLGGAARIARELPGSTVIGLAAPRGAAAIAAMLGCWLAGSAYLPVDVTHPPARIEAALADSQVELVLAGAGCPPIHPDTGRRRLELAELLPADPTRWPTDAPVVSPESPGTAYRLYTSGSTGRPKGVTIGHAALAAFLRAIGELVPLTARDVVPQLTTPSFDISGLEIWLPLISGATVRIVTEHDAVDGAALADRLAGVTLAQLTPTGWQVLLAGGWPGDPALRALVGGEAVPPALVGELLSRTRQVWNVYGPTEATIWSTAHRVSAADAAAGSVPIGAPLGNTVVHLVDTAGRLVPPGVVGEVVLGGYSIADGYHRREELTAEKFVILPDLPAGAAGQRFYRTGDLGRWRDDGVLEYLGRSDSQVKVRGVRIETGEIEAALTRIPGVHAAAVTVDRPGTETARLIGYLVAEPATDDRAIGSLLAAELPAAYLPEQLIRLDALPLTPNGKLDRSALPAPATEPARFDAPQTETEELIAELWCEVLGVERVGRTDSFLALGGHSLPATRVAAMLRAELDVPVPVRLLFTHPRLADFATELDELLMLELST